MFHWLLCGDYVWGEKVVQNFAPEFPNLVYDDGTRPKGSQRWVQFGKCNKCGKVKMRIVA